MRSVRVGGENGLLGIGGADSQEDSIAGVEIKMLIESGSQEASDGTWKGRRSEGRGEAATADAGDTAGCGVRHPPLQVQATRLPLQGGGAEARHARFATRNGEPGRGLKLVHESNADVVLSDEQFTGPD